ncbi:MAG TPA: phosphomethylpyrimidine synthase, partial [Methanosarcina sp.]|nr:phosphomethylpyrimidine synthase [Methanosarcina sp.]
MTLIEDAKNGIITPSIEAVAKGFISIPKNNRRETLPVGIGKYM